MIKSQNLCPRALRCNILALTFFLLGMCLVSCASKNESKTLLHTAKVITYPDYKVAILDFKVNFEREIGNYLWEQDICYSAKGIVSNLVEKTILDLKKFQVIERSNLDKVIKEYSLSISGLTKDHRDAIELLNADAIIIGEINALYTRKQIVSIGGRCTFSIKMIDTRSGEIIYIFNADESTQLGNYSGALTSAISKFKQNLAVLEIKTSRHP